MFWPLTIVAVMLLWPLLIGGAFSRRNKRAWVFVAAVLANVVWLAALANFQEPDKSAQTTQQPAASVAQQPEAVQGLQDENQEPADSDSDAGAESGLYDVVEVVDGDTIKINYNGVTEIVRLIGIDTPEVVDPRQPVQCFGREASAHARELLAGESVRLESDPSQGERDKYGRLLRYVFLEDGTNFNQLMIAEGYAYEYTYQIPYQYQQDFRNAELEARNNSKGLWAPDTCDGQRTAPQRAAAPAPTPGTGSCAIKGNIASDGEKIYHVPGQRFYDKTVIDESKGERWFCSESDAQAVGWRRSKV